ncbi:MAG: hypothetical protein IJ890_05625 [Clostridia bacterium]|nr:hypothetical protein [Clostridia bacterium]
MTFQLKKIPIQNSIDTAKLIKDLILSSTNNLSYRLLVEDICRNTEYASEFAILDILYRYGRKHFTYLKDIETVEYIKTPDRIYNEIQVTGKFVGDCDDATVFMGSMIINAGFLPIIRLIEIENSGYFSHIYCYTVVDGKFVSMDIADSKDYYINAPKMTDYMDIVVE